MYSSRRREGTGASLFDRPGAYKVTMNLRTAGAPFSLLCARRPNSRATPLPWKLPNCLRLNPRASKCPASQHSRAGADGRLPSYSDRLGCGHLAAFRDASSSTPVADMSAGRTLPTRRPTLADRTPRVPSHTSHGSSLTAGIEAKHSPAAANARLCGTARHARPPAPAAQGFRAAIATETTKFPDPRVRRPGGAQE